MKILYDIAHLFPITNPTWIFLVVLVIILFAPLLFNRIRVPHLVGMILAGVLVGEHGFNILARDSSFELFGKMGLYYIMFLASLEMDMEGLKKNRTRGIVFGLITFTIPFVIGFGVGQWVLGFRWDASLLLSCILASHTLVAYPVVGRYGLSRHDCVTIAIAGTMLALLLALFTLAGISASAKGDISARFWLGFVAFCVGTAAGVLMAKLMNLLSKEKVNPLIGSAGVSAVPMAARVSNKVSLSENPGNFILMQAMGPNVSGVIGSAVVAGVLYTLCR